MSESETPTTDPAPRARRLPPLRLVLPALAVLALAAVATSLLLRLHTLRGEGSGAAAAARTAAEQIGTLWTVDQATSKQVYAKLLAGSTGPLKAQLAQQSGTFQQVVQSQGVSSTGSVVQVGVSDQKASSAKVLVAVNATVSAAKGKSDLRQYRMRASMQRVGDRWLVSDLEFVP